jgi:hypothetical protein
MSTAAGAALVPSDGQPGRACGIPTMYAGVRFRSRLEARWAAMFDLLEWGWDYEPLELDHYIPDFVLRFAKPLLVEVKPALTLDELRTHTDKIDASGWRGEALVVGACLFPCSGWDHPTLGLLGEFFDDDLNDAIPRCYDEAVTMRCNGCRKLSFCHMSWSYRCRVSGCYSGNDHVGNPWGAFRDAWVEAGNVTQWLPRR